MHQLKLQEQKLVRPYLTGPCYTHFSAMLPGEQAERGKRLEKELFHDSTNFFTFLTLSNLSMK